MIKRFALKLIQGIKGYRPDVVTLMLLGLVVFLWFRPPASVNDLQLAAPDMAVQLIGGKTITLAQLKGKVVLLNFWATWCPYCRHELPAMQEFYKDYQSRGFEILAVSVDDTPEKLLAFTREHKLPFPVAVMLHNPPAALGSISKIPTSFVIDRCGIVRKKISGQVHYARLKNLVTPLLTANCSTP